MRVFPKLMNFRFYCIVAFFLFSISSDFSATAAYKTPQFSDKFISYGTIYLPYAELEEPFAAWMNKERNLSRIDYYGGMVKTYQLANVKLHGPYGISLKIAPMTDEKVSNKKTCFKVNGVKEAPMKVQSVIPNVTDFQFIGMEVISGHPCEKWQLVETEDKKTSKYTFWVTYVKTTKSDEGSSQKVAVPVKYEMKGYNSLLGSHFDHYIIVYTYYSIDTPSDEMFEVRNMTCGSFPGPGLDHTYMFNPMKEFADSDDAHVHATFGNFQKFHSKKYQDVEEEDQRRDAYRHNMRYIHSKNRAGLLYRLAPNHLTDRSSRELKYLRGRIYSSGYNGGKPFFYDKDADVPDSMDWRLYGAVTQVKDQAICGSCWSFGSTGALEGAHFLKTGQLVRLSQQALIDCSWGFGNNGCDGGEDFRVYQWVKKHGIPTEESYGHYLGQDGYCHVDEAEIGAQIKGWVNVTSGDAGALKAALAKHGPVSVAIDASHLSFAFYANGVYYEEKCGSKSDELDHAVLAVGYGTLNNEPYWLVKNSWSTYWGNNGYVLMSQRNNNCGVATSPTFVEM